MQQRQAVFQIKGMSQDLADSKFDSTLAFENFNIRLNPTDDNTLLSLCNEKGNKLSSLTISGVSDASGGEFTDDEFTNWSIYGYSVLYKTIVLFGLAELDGFQRDFIATLVPHTADTSHDFDATFLYIGNLGFSIEHPIETLPLYESEDIQKVYWVDGINQPRVINIKGNIVSGDDTQFNFLPSLTLNEGLNVERVTSSVGMFPGGTVQYCFTYSKKNGQETKIVYTSNLLYTTFEDRAVGPDEITSASYRLTISNADSSRFDYLNIYSIIRTSEGGTPILRLVTRISLDSNVTSYTYIDTNTTGEIVDPTFLLYVGGEDLIAQTLTSKDNTLFLGNIKVNRSSVPDEIKTAIEEGTIFIGYGGSTTITNWLSSSGYVSYKNPLLNNNVTYLRGGNTYRIGIQFQDNLGNWSEPIKVEDFSTTTKPRLSGSSLLLPKYHIVVDEEIIPTLRSYYTKVRPVIVYPEPWERGVIAQGIVCPTVFRPIDRNQNLPYAQASWFFRPFSKDLDKSLEFRTLHRLPNNMSDMAEVQFIDSEINEDLWALIRTDGTNLNSESFYIDSTMSTFHSPDVNDSLTDSLISPDNTWLSLVGAFTLDSSYGKYSIATNLTNKPNATPAIIDTIDNVNTVLESQIGVTNVNHILATSAAYKTSRDIIIFHTYDYPWHNNNSLKRSGDADKTEYTYKILSNIRASQKFEYFTSTNEYKCPSLADARIYRQAFGDTSIGINRQNHLAFTFNSLNYKGYDNKAYILSNSTYNDVFTVSEGSKTKDSDDLSIPVSIKYKSTDHVVLNFNPQSGRDITPDLCGIPVPRYYSSVYESEDYQDGRNRPYWLTNGAHTVIVADLPTSISADSLSKEVMWITELRRDIPSNIFGGTSDYAIKNNKWIPCGRAVTIPSGSTSNQLNIPIEEGDTIFNRWDCVKTLPYSNEDKNQVVEIMSFMCESYVNTAGRYDKHRDQLDYTYLDSSVNFNAINPAYNNRNNFFSFRIIDTEGKSNNYPTQITWSLPKTLGEDVDTWTSISLASILDFDGNKGEVRALRTFRNNIFCFQDKGISEVIYNPSAAISTTSGVPIELANSGKVEGKRYITEGIGCTNKWSICITPNGIYFVDNIDKKIYILSDGIRCISTEFGFDSWMNKNLKGVEVWDPDNFKDITTQYDRTVGDVYFITNDKCLAFNEKIGRFSSFYSYDRNSFMMNLDDQCIAIKKDTSIWDELWLQHAGNYNSFYGSTQPYYTDVVVNENPTLDKVFTNVEFRADSWLYLNGEWRLQPGTTFDKLTAYNEYQNGVATLSNPFSTAHKDTPYNLKRKFRVWRANIPRNTTNKYGSSTHNYTRDRIRNTWAHIKLEKSNPSSERTVLHDVVVDYLV